MCVRVCRPNYDPRNWSPVGSAYTNYGERARWLCAAASMDCSATLYVGLQHTTNSNSLWQVSPLVQTDPCKCNHQGVLHVCHYVLVSSGHNIEAAWLLADGVDELQARGTIDSSKAAAMRKALQEIGEAAVAAGYDDKHGGL